jgi:uncharacterized tellurite resistance protein B-like protein
MGQGTLGRPIKEEHFANLIAVAYSDGFLNEQEIEFLSRRAEDYGLAIDLIHSMIEKADELKFVVPLNNEDKEDQLADIVYIAMSDGKVHEKEYELCLSIAQKLGFTQKDLDYIIDLTKKLWEEEK